jgi:uncharacterized protein (DUF2062 family)
MVLGRRTRLPFVRRILDFLWPRMPFGRVLAYYKRRVARLQGTPHSIAAGFAAGAAVSFTPFMGLHFLLGALLAYVLRGNLIASAVGTVVGNPWTFPLIWVTIYEVGTLVMPDPGTEVQWDNLSLTYLTEHISDVLVPMMVGGVILSSIVFPLVYFPILRMIETFRRLREERRRRRAERRAREEAQLESGGGTQ